MKLAKVIERIMTRLGSVPGLSFLSGYVIAAKTAGTRFGQRKGDYEAYVDNISGAGADVRDAVRGGPAEEEEHGQDFDERRESPPEAVDWYDEYEDDSVLGPGSSHLPADDYPASDDHNQYFDDDYRS